MKIQRLEKLCRALQTERNDLNKKVQDLCALASPVVSGEALEPPKDQPQGSSEELAPQGPPVGECLAPGQAECCVGPVESLGELSIGVPPQEENEDTAGSAQ